MNIEKTKLFITLAENLNFHRSAQLEHVSTSKLSRVIQSIEEELGVSLFQRDNRHVELTEHGKRFLEFAREQIAQWSTFHDSLNVDKKDISGTISIYCSVTASYSFLYEILQKARYTYPKIRIKLHTGDTADAIDRVNKGFEDIAIAAKPESLSKALSFKQFDTSPLMFFCSCNNTSSDNTEYEKLIKNATPSAWSSIPMIVSERGLARERFDAWVKSTQFTPNIFSQVSGHEAIVSMVSLGLGIGLIPKIVVENSPLKDRVKPFAVQPKLKPYEVGACVQQRRLKSPLVSALWSLIS